MVDDPIVPGAPEIEPPTPGMSKEERIKLLARVVCICKGIPLGRVLKGMEGCKTVAEVNQKVGTGSGGCQGQRCGPRIRTLLRKMEERETRRNASASAPGDEDSGE